MSISADTVKRMATLARLALDEKKIPALQRDLDRVLALFAALEKIDVSGVQPLFHPGDPSLYLRDDVVSEKDQREQFQPLAAETSADLYLVPKVIEAAT
jgi:aspartyl-tRNA(Asn)/glutamyl-tRNA(Gln) amidotransferase subunit C